MQTIPPSPPPRVASRIRWLLLGLAATITLVFTVGGWLLLLEAEDAVQESYLGSMLREVALSDPGTTRMPAGFTRVTDPSWLLVRHGLKDPPRRPGLHEFFADDEGRRALIPEGLIGRLRLWLVDPLEREYRLWFEPARDGRSAVWVVADLKDREFSEANLGPVTAMLGVLAAGVLVAALLASAVITRWALRPMLALADRVRTREVGRETGRTSGSTLAPGLPDDEIGYLARVLDEYHERLRESLERERRFIADCSHELRTPVTTLKGAATLLREMPHDSEARERLMARIERAGRRLERLIQTFLMLAREKRLPPAAGEVALSAVIAEVLDEWRVLHPSHPLSVQVETHAEVTLRCHREIVAVLVHNLVGNAFAHLTGGRMDIVVASDPSGAAILRFEDDGPGLPEFTGGTAARTQDVGSTSGYGLGLSLVDRLCAMHGWSITKRPRSGGGTWIEVVLPQPNPPSDPGDASPEGRSGNREDAGPSDSEE
jgi:signal transduction histidine kinase